MRLLTRADVERLVSMPEAIAIMRSLFVELGESRVNLPERAVIGAADAMTTALFMPAHVPALGGLGVKVVTVVPDNPERRQLPRIMATILLLDPVSGEVVAVMEGTWLTALRTAAVSAVAADLLARPAARDLVVFGAGVQARAHVAALLAVRPLDSVTFVAPAESAVEAIVAESREKYAGRCGFSGTTDPALAPLETADLVVAATTSTTPIFDGRRLAPGTHVTAVGSFKPHVQEVDVHTIVRASVFVDDRRSALAEAGDLLVPIGAGLIGPDHVRGDLGDLVCVRHAGRQADDEITLFKSVGLAAEDVAIAQVVLGRARVAGVGQTMTL